MQIIRSKIIFASLLVIIFNLLLHEQYISKDDFTAYNDYEWDGNIETREINTERNDTLQNNSTYRKYIKQDDDIRSDKNTTNEEELAQKEHKNDVQTPSNSTPESKEKVEAKTKINANEKNKHEDDEKASKYIDSINPYKYKFYRQRYRSPIVLEEYKLLWFLNPKVASTSTKFLLARMLNQTVDPLTTKEETLQFKKLRDYPSWKAKYILGSPAWTRVMIFREPKERLLSAYLGKEQRYHDKEERVSKSYLKINCCRHERIRKEFDNCWSRKFTFKEFIDITNKCSDMHWTRQYDIVEDFKFVNFLISFQNLADGTKRLLEKLGVWERYGATGWVSGSFTFGW